MDSISKGLSNKSTSLVTLITLIIFLVFMVTVLPQQAEAAFQNSGGAPSPDTSFHYSVDGLYAMAEAYGESGRQAYIRARFTFDLAFPLVYTAFLSTAISWCFQRAFGPDFKWGFANLVPALGMVFDFLENIATSLVIARYPTKTPVIDVLAPVFTTLKWIFIYGSFIFLLGGFLYGAWKLAVNINRRDPA